jgi:hypothetical protein
VIGYVPEVWRGAKGPSHGLLATIGMALLRPSVKKIRKTQRGPSFATSKSLLSKTPVASSSWRSDGYPLTASDPAPSTSLLRVLTASLGKNDTPVAASEPRRVKQFVQCSKDGESASSETHEGSFRYQGKRVPCTHCRMGSRLRRLAQGRRSSQRGR